MAGFLNRATILGHVGKDPTTKTMNSGDKVANFSIATSESWTDKQSGEKKEKTQWHNIVVWGKLADIVEKYVRKGSKVFVEGAIETRKYEQNGVEKYTTEIVLRGFDTKLLLLDGKSDGAGRNPGAARDEDDPPPKTGGGGETTVYDLDDEIPFVSRGEMW